MLIDLVWYLCEMFVSDSTEHQHLAVAESEVQRAAYANTRFLQCTGLLFKNTSLSYIITTYNSTALSTTTLRSVYLVEHVQKFSGISQF